MITERQIRAARGLLGWDAADLAEKTGLTRATLSNIENGLVQARAGSIEKIARVFSENGVEFIGDRGVAVKDENYRLIEGPDCYLRLLNEVHQTLRGKQNAEALFICVDDTISTPEVRLANNQIREAGIKCRYLCSDKAEHFDFDINDYRAIPEEYYTNSVMIVFEHRVATLRGENNAVLIISDEEQANMLRGLFEMIWKHSPQPAAQQKASEPKP